MKDRHERSMGATMRNGSSRIGIPLAVAAALAALTSCAGEASTPSPTRTPSSVASSTAQPTSEAAPVSEQGYVMSCSGVRTDGNNVLVELYTNSTVQVPASVVVVRAGEDGEPLLIPSDAGQPPTFTDGTVSADVPLIDATTRSDAGSAGVRGTFEPSGNVRQIDDEIEDAGQRVRSVGTNEDLTTDLDVQVGEEQVDLECSEAFAFDLQVTKTPIG